MDPASPGRGSPVIAGRYEILTRLATGGMAEILLGRQTGPSGFERAVVIKRILPHLAQDPEFVRMLLDEARLCAGIRHPNVVQVQDLVVQDDDVFLVMEYLEGESAVSLLKKLASEGEWLDSGLVAHIGAELCAGLHAAHELTDSQGRPQNLVHRDVSPQNIFITYDGPVKLLDFGVAKAADSSTKTEAGLVKGKFAYMSPEQAQSLPIDRRSDIYSLGVVLYELGTGRNPFKRATDAATLRAALDEPLVPPSRLAVSFAEALEVVCLKALERDPQARYANAAEMRHDLLAVVRSLGGDTAPTETLAQLMARLFPDRIAQKRELLHRLRSGASAAELPSVVTGGSGAGSKSAGVSPPASAAGPSSGAAPPARSLRPWAIAAVVAAAVAAAVALKPGGWSSRRDEPAAAPVYAPCAQPRVRVERLRGEWATPNTIQWKWDLEGDAHDLLALELIVGTDPLEVAARARDPSTTARTARVWTDRERPELRYLEVPRTAKVERLSGTLTDGHAPETVYHAQLAALEAAGCRSVSQSAAIRTSPPPFQELVLMRDRVPPGASVEPAHTPTPTGAGFVFPCPTGQPACFNNLRIEGLTTPIALAPGPFAQSYIEVSLSCRARGTSFWSSVSVCFDGGCNSVCARECTPECISRCTEASKWDFAPFSVVCGDGSPRRLQLPLRAFHAGVESSCARQHATPLRSDCVLSRETMGKRFYAVWLSGTWPRGALVTFHDVTIRW